MDHKISDKTEPAVSVVELEVGFPKISRRRRYWTNSISLLRRSFDRNDLGESPWPKICRHFIYVFTVAVVLGAVAIIVYHSILLDLVRVLSPPKLPDTGLSKIVSEWVEPGTIPTSPSWLPNFSRDILPRAIHSHNDYWRAVPLFQALSLGVTGVEADCHLVNGELFVGHTARSLRPNRTFRTLYLDPLTTILENQNPNNNFTNGTINGVWDTKPTASIVLMTDLKTEGYSTLEAVQQQLQPFREKGWLTYWNGTAVVPGPIIHVGTGNTPFDAVLNSTFSNTTYRDVFFDAPLDALTPSYNASNSYYASTSMSHLFWGIPSSGLSQARLDVVKGQIEMAKSLGLVSRYWNTPSWPATRRMNVWKQLVDLDVGMLNADEILEASRWNWKWCSVLGLHLC
ncbi:uncharacterized protein LY89DRAFT_739572 [Mollisia scopiformis]|uniref:Altered inheritance of mitochondria protein 6 n=1 Tax=Mollisia scopiformis TaxID=149040 RepID=A0A194WUN6_MOLSC|nr:uncharacterized protein LY89DRAFT_739572 [Mollisia scopiformis]KUJ11384.1 hypothetical protein LY89DRAFT_739572 [Mollisia scopiformis]